MTVDLGERSYPILVGSGVLSRVTETVRFAPGAVITDVNVDKLHGERLRELPFPAGHKIVLPAGEDTKSVLHWQAILEQLALWKTGRDGGLLAFGGGVVGDVAGFAAATYMRGIPFVQLPTTLLAMVDSSVGGKTGINLAAGKNLAGAFHQPQAVVADMDVLNSLPAREFSSGLAEVVKTAVALDAEFFSWLERHAGRIMDKEAAVLAELVVECCRLKARVVKSDEREAGLRAVLNFGHTLGHGLEKASGYALSHGEAVAWGMRVAMAHSRHVAGLPQASIHRVERLLQAFGLATGALDGIPWGMVWEAMQQDKKNRQGVVHMVLCEQIGRGMLPRPVTEEEMKAAMKEWTDGIR
ncbi:MAG: 3-dehydroquinate synthase [Verrucomicrobiota bacterium]|nr:3-dehydroquinate synthase [Verrucomicrobiota bacterium]